MYEQESDPFYSARGGQGELNQLLQAYLKAESFWKQHVSGAFSRNDLFKDEFSEESLDMEKKGYIVLEDIVRFLNMETGTFFRNRDVYLIFKRISQQDKIQFKELL